MRYSLLLILALAHCTPYREGCSSEQALIDSNCVVSNDASSNGKADSACVEPMLRCGSSCIDPRIDRQNCGSCYHLCDASQACRNGACIVPNPGGACSVSTDCPGGICYPTSSGFPGGFCWYAGCRSHSDCGSSGQCRPEGESFCTHNCRFLNDCRDGYVCLPGGVCWPDCNRAPSRCGSGRCASNGICNMTCNPISSPTGCSAGSECITSGRPNVGVCECTATTTCLPGWSCSEVTRDCTDCADDSVCPVGFHCRSGICVQ